MQLENTTFAQTCSWFCHHRGLSENVPILASAHLLQKAGLLVQSDLHFGDDLLEPASLIFHVSLLPGQTVLQHFGIGRGQCRMIGKEKSMTLSLLPCRGVWTTTVDPFYNLSRRYCCIVKLLHCEPSNAFWAITRKAEASATERSYLLS